MKSSTVLSLAAVALAGCAPTVVDPITSEGAPVALEAVLGAPVGPGDLRLVHPSVTVPIPLELRQSNLVIPLKLVQTGSDSAALLSWQVCETTVSFASWPPAFVGQRFIAGGIGEGDYDVFDNGDSTYAFVARKFDAGEFIMSERVAPGETPVVTAWEGPSEFTSPHLASYDGATLMTGLGSTASDDNMPFYVARERAGVVDAPGAHVMCAPDTTGLVFFDYTATIGLDDHFLTAAWGADNSCVPTAENDARTLSLISISTHGAVAPSVLATFQTDEPAMSTQFLPRKDGAWLLTTGMDGIEVRAISDGGATVGEPTKIAAHLSFVRANPARFAAVSTDDGGLMLAWFAVLPADGDPPSDWRGGPMNIARLDASGTLTAMGSAEVDYFSEGQRDLAFARHGDGYVIFTSMAPTDSEPIFFHALEVTDSP